MHALFSNQNAAGFLVLSLLAWALIVGTMLVASWLEERGPARVGATTTARRRYALR